MNKWLFFFAAIFFCSSSFADRGVKKCLQECYGIDGLALSQILEKFSPLLDNDPVVDLFLEESNKLNIYSGLPLDMANPPYHSVLFENSHLRVSWAVTKSGEQEPAQKHPWKTLMVVIRSSQFYSQREDGVAFEDNWPIGVYLLDSSSELMSCKNIGPDDYNGLVFEIKSSADRQ